MIGMKRPTALYLQSIALTHSYQSLKEAFSKYLPVSSIRMFQHQRTGRFSGDVLLIFAPDSKLSELVEEWKREKIVEAKEWKIVDEIEMQKII